ncbi:unnamed protein product [Rhizophagus irregularis]|nr:unnamed protein product [Rhizophagus irregularis]CAB4413919.1 unnamed protein product [Rhizophagus irregularis]
MERAQFLSLVTVLEAFFNIKRRISEVITVIASNTPPNSPIMFYLWQGAYLFAKTCKDYNFWFTTKLILL